MFIDKQVWLLQLTISCYTVLKLIRCDKIALKSIDLLFKADNVS
jgi:hypothetical protein